MQPFAYGDVVIVIRHTHDAAPQLELFYTFSKEMALSVTSTEVNYVIMSRLHSY